MKASGSSRSRSCRRGSASLRRSSSVVASLSFSAHALTHVVRSSLTGTSPPAALGRIMANSDATSMYAPGAGSSPGESTSASANCAARSTTSSRAAASAGAS
eukprot:2907697-Prymnesium_polylepis.1